MGREGKETRPVEMNGNEEDGKRRKGRERDKR